MMLHTCLCPCAFLQPLNASVGCSNTPKMCVTSLLLTQCTLHLILSWPVAMPGKHCCYGQCKADSRYPDRHPDVFFPFPKPFSKLDICKEWIKACGRPHEQLNPDKITKHYYVCSKVITNFSVKQNTHFYVDDNTKAIQLPHKLYQSAKAVM